MRRPGFTLIELLVAITIIGLLAGLAVGGMWRADASAKRLNTKATIAKIGPQLTEIWDSFRTRRLPFNPAVTMQPASPQFNNSVSWLKYYANVESACGVANPIYPDPQAPPVMLGVNPNNNRQVAALRLAATHELMRLELPCRFSDFTSSAVGTAPASAAPVQALLLPSNGVINPTGLSEKYRQFFMAHANTWNAQYESAECLYMILKFASQNDLGASGIADDTRLVGDADGDGMPELQDAFNAGLTGPAMSNSPYTQHHMPISFIRWPVGFLSYLQPGPGGSPPSGSWQATVTYANANHEPFDSMKIDPRAFAMLPLVFSAGTSSVAAAPYSDYDVWEGHSYSGLTAAQIPFAQNDPYYTQSLTPIFPLSGNMALDPLPGTQMDSGTAWPNGSVGSGAYGDNITNHDQVSGR